LARRLFPRSQRSSAALTGASGVSASATMIQEIEFAPDSPLEEGVHCELVSESEISGVSIPMRFWVILPSYFGHFGG
jgi:hypothetical protein